MLVGVRIVNWGRAVSILIAAVLIIWLIMSMKNIIILLFLSIIFAYLFLPLINFYSRFGMPRFLAIIISYLTGIAITALSLLIIVPPMASQIASFIDVLPQYIDRLLIITDALMDRFNLRDGQFLTPQQIVSTGGRVAKSMIEQAWSAILGIAGLIIIPILSFFMIDSAPSIWKSIQYIIPERYKEEITQLAITINHTLKSYMIGQLLLFLSVGIMTTVGLLILGVPFALVLGLFAAMMEVVPNIGPIIAAVPAVLLTLSNGGWLMALGVAGFYIFVQAMESYILAPTIVGKSVELSPLLIILAIMVGGHFAGILGVLVAVPAASVLRLVVIHLARRWVEGRR